MLRLLSWDGCFRGKLGQLWHEQGSQCLVCGWHARVLQNS